jgi:hypothetical protein
LYVQLLCKTKLECVKLRSVASPSYCTLSCSELDAEKGSFVTVWVNANDSAPYGPRSQLVAVNVTVIDVNDNSPIFDQFLYKVTVSLNIAVGQSVVSVHASDADSGLNSQLTYNLSDVDQPSQANMAQYFTIGPSTGLITVARTLPASFTSCVLTVTATDQGTPPLSGKGNFIWCCFPKFRRNHFKDRSFCMFSSFKLNL